MTGEEIRNLINEQLEKLKIIISEEEFIRLSTMYFRAINTTIQTLGKRLDDDIAIKHNLTRQLVHFIRLFVRCDYY